MQTSGFQEFQSPPPEHASPEGEQLTIETAIARLQGSDLGLRSYAAWWLGRFRINEPAAIDALIVALDDEDDRTEAGGYPLRRNAARALGKLNDRRAVPALIEALNCSDYYVREAVAQSLEQLGDPACIPALTNLLASGLQDGQLGSEPQELTQPYDAIMEALGRLKAVDAVPIVQPFLNHPIPRIQYAAARALYQLTLNPVYAEQLVQALSNSSLQLRRAALADLGTIGYLPSAHAIANTLAENSLKLISLKGLLEHTIRQANADDLNDDVVHVMQLMDGLL